MKLWFGHAEPTGRPSAGQPPADAGPDADWYADKPLPGAPPACCCPAQPVVTVWMPPRRGRHHAVDLLLCGHHYRASRHVLAAAGAAVFDADSLPVSSAAPSAADRARRRTADERHSGASW